LIGSILKIICKEIIKDQRKKLRDAEKYDAQRARVRNQYEKRIQENQARYERKIQRIRQEKIQEEQRRKEIFDNKETIVKSRLEKFNLSEQEAELVFGKNWRLRLSKPTYEFVTEELVNRVIYKITDTDDYTEKISSIMEKVLAMVDHSMHQFGKEEDWDDIMYENWEESWQEVKDSWRRTKSSYQNRTNSTHKRRYYRINDFDEELKDYYKILQVAKDATVSEIKEQYRKLIIQFHPDKNKSPNSRQKCAEIIEAYEALTN